MKTRARRRAALACVCLAMSVGATRCERKPEPVPAATANVLLITLDTLRPDALGFIGGTNATPAIDRLAREGFAFPSAVSPVPLTFPSHCALMTGRLPRALGLRDNGQVLAAAPATLAERLHDRGYATAAFVSGFPLDSIFGLDRGFDTYDDTLTRTSTKGEEPERSAGATVAAARAWLATARPPWFLWVHLYDPHYPYDPPAAFRRAGSRGNYDGEVAYADSAIGELLASAALAQGGALTVFAGDHAESLGEHGEGTHGYFVYDSTVVVPLVFHFPGRLRPGASPAAARLIDVAPTILDLLHAAPFEGADGSSLEPLLSGRSPATDPALVETYQPWLSYGWSPLHAMRSRGWKLIEAPRPELYDLQADPGEQHNRFGESPEKARELKSLLLRARSTPAMAAQPAADDEALKRLRALGYLGGSNPGAEPPAEGLRDPKDGAALRERLTRGDELLRKGDHRGAAIEFEAVLESDPDNRFALHRSGLALLALGKVPQARTRLEKAARLDPTQPEVRWALAEALGREGRYEASVEQWEEATRLQPRRAEAWANLGSALGRSGKPREAVTAMRHAVELAPEDSHLLARLAFAEFGAGDLEHAAQHLEQASRASPGDFHHAGALGLILVRLNRPGEARAWLARCVPEEPEFAEARQELARIEARKGQGRVP